MKSPILILLLTFTVFGFQQTYAQDNGEDDNVILNHNFADGFDNWILIGSEAEDRFELFGSDNGNRLFYEGGPLIQIFSEPVAAEPGTEYLFRINVETFGNHGGGANMKLIFMNSDLNDGEGDRLGEKWFFLPEDTQEFVDAELSMVAPQQGETIPEGVDKSGASVGLDEYPADATHLQVELATWHDGHDVTVEAIYVLPQMATSMEDHATGPKQFRLEQNYPNPFNPTTEIKFSLAHSSMVTLEVFNLLGQRVATLVNGNKSAGEHQVSFDASTLNSGVYLYRLQSESYSQVRKLTLIK